MRLHLIVGYYKGADRDREMPNVIDAWDEYCVDGNEQGFEDAIKKAKEDCEDVRLLDLNIPEKAVTSLFDVPVVEL